MKYKYKMFDGSSGLVTGEMEAAGVEEVKERLHEGGYRVISVEKSGGKFNLTKPRRVLPKGQLAVMFSQLALMSSGGLDLVTVMELMARQSKGLQREKLEFIVESVRQGKLLS